MKLYSNRSGYLCNVDNNYECYIPFPISKIELNYNARIINLIAKAYNEIGKINLISDYLPCKDIFLNMFLKKESIISSQIEGTESSLSNKKNNENEYEQSNIKNYIKALNEGISFLKEKTISLDYIKQIHSLLVNEESGKFRNIQNWIGSNDSTIFNASYIPPSVSMLDKCLKEFDNDLKNNDEIDPLIKLSLINYQFDTIQPFLEGNGRIGRLLIPLYLIEKNVLNMPFVGMSSYFNNNKNEYYRLLMNTRFKGSYEEWIEFFLEGLVLSCQKAFSALKHLKELDEDIKKEIHSLKSKNENNLLNTLYYFYKHPYFKSHDLVNNLNISKPTANSIINTFIDLEIISPIDDKQRNSTYRFNEYMNIFDI